MDPYALLGLHQLPHCSYEPKKTWSKFDTVGKGIRFAAVVYKSQIPIESKGTKRNKDL